MGGKVVFFLSSGRHFPLCEETAFFWGDQDRVFGPRLFNPNYLIERDELKVVQRPSLRGTPLR